MKKIAITLLIISSILTFSDARVSCKQFKTWDEAQSYFKSKKHGYKSLDKNSDGKACENLWRESLGKDKQQVIMKILKYGGPHGVGKTYSSMSSCEQEKAKLTKANKVNDLSYKCEKK